MGREGGLALTFTPALCATLLKPVDKGHGAHEGRGFSGWFNRAFDAGNRRYRGWVASLLARSGRALVVYALLGSSRVLSVSSTTTLAILAGTQLGLAVPDGDPARLLTATATLTALVGALLILAALFIAVLQGFEAHATPEGVSRATTRTVVMASLAVLALDFVLTTMMFSI